MKTPLLASKPKTLMKLSNIFYIALLSITMLFSASAQETINGNIAVKESIKPLRVGLKLGVPSILTLNAEYVTPLLNDRVAPFIDYMSLKYEVDEAEVSYNNFEIGSNVYLADTGKGLYAGVSYFSSKSKGNFPDTDFDSGTYNGKADLNISTLNLKLGAKLGRVFYFRVEVGYGFGDIPQSVTVRSTETNESSTEEFPEIFGYSDSGVLVFNIGFGFAFL